ncbi:MAG TPA: hypothetical protein ENG60_04175 [Thermoplasmatales archaeon]|nr:hypothetical protein [Thermoplasmatales archaeon]HEX17586.1 hypothetical protein [Thermoplasmatales archaeon]
MTDMGHDKMKPRLKGIMVGTAVGIISFYVFLVIFTDIIRRGYGIIESPGLPAMLFSFPLSGLIGGAVAVFVERSENAKNALFTSAITGLLVWLLNPIWVLDPVLFFLSLMWLNTLLFSGTVLLSIIGGLIAHFCRWVSGSFH